MCLCGVEGCLIETSFILSIFVILFAVSIPNAQEPRDATGPARNYPPLVIDLILLWYVGISDRHG